MKTGKKHCSEKEKNIETITILKEKNQKIYMSLKIVNINYFKNWGKSKFK